MRSPEITSLQNPRVKQVVRLRDHRNRAAGEPLVIDGAREILRAVDAGVELVELFVCDELCRSAEAQTLAEHAHAGKLGAADVTPVSASVFDKLAYGQRRDGVVAVACRPDTSLARLQLPECPMVVVLVGVEKPGNVGAVVRSADGAGASAVIVVDRGGDPFNTNAIRASLGTVFSLPIAEADATATLAWLRQHRLALRAARPQASQLYSAVDWTGGSAIILGSEAAGLDDAWQADDIVPVALPMQGAADSLNVSVTAAVLCYEALRQRR